MQRLIEAGLFGGGLVPVDTPALVSRYNACLEQLGIESTSLHRFDIDGIGWSPQVAEEKGDHYYLSAGPANPMGVIISPTQRKKPVWHPYSSYERGMLEAYFQQYRNAISDITSSTFIGLDIDQELTCYESPDDLALVRYVVLRSVAGGLFDAAREQRDLVAQFNSDGLGWFDSKLRRALIDSGRRWGDLRHRRTDIPDFRFDVGSFYTEAFGGVFLFRPPKSERPILVLQDESQAATRQAAAERFTVSNTALPDTLRKAGLLEINFAWYARHPEVISAKCECLLADVVSRDDPQVEFGELKRAQKRQRAHKLADKLPHVFHELERFAREMTSGARPRMDTLSPELRAMLFQPNHRLPEPEQEVVWQFLARLRPLDVYRLYVSDRNRFFHEYTTWPDTKKRWAISLIRARYVPRMSQ